MTDIERQIELLNEKAEQESTRHINKVIKIMSQAKALQERGKITQEQYDNIAYTCGYRAILTRDVSKYVENILYYRYRLLDLYSRILDVYKKYKLGYKKSTSFPDLTNEMIEFFKYIGCYKLFTTMRGKQMIIPDKKAKRSTCGDAGRLSYIHLEEPYTSKTKAKQVTLVHEMGHAYYNYVLANQKRTIFERGINVEISSIFFEKAFFDFLLENSDVDKDIIETLIKNKETRYQSLTKDYRKPLDILDIPSSEAQITSLTIKYLDNKGNKKTHNLAEQPYIIGNLASAKLFADYVQDREGFIKNYPDILHTINNMPFEEVITNFADTDSLDNYLGRHLVLKPTKKGA